MGRVVGGDPVPEHWTPQQALAVFALLHDLSAAIWQRYEAELLPLVDPLLNTDTDPQLAFANCWSQFERYRLS